MTRKKLTDDIRNTSGKLVVLMSPFFREGALGHHETWPLALAKAFEHHGFFTVIIGQEGTQINGQRKPYPKLGYGFAHPHFPVLSPNIFVYIWFLERKLGTGQTLIHLVESGPETLVPLMPLLVSRKRFAHLFISRGFSPKTGTKKIDYLIRLSHERNLKLVLPSRQMKDSLSIQGDLFDYTNAFSLAPEKGIPRTGGVSEHKRVLIVVRGKDFAAKFEAEADTLCKECTFVYHFPLDRPPKRDFPENIKLDNRQITGTQYFRSIQEFDYHVLMYDNRVFDFVSARALDALRLRIPIMVPKASETHRVTQIFGGVVAVDFQSQSLSNTLIHEPDFSQFSGEPPQSVFEYVDYLIRSTSRQGSHHSESCMRVSLSVLKFYLLQCLSWFKFTAARKLFNLVSTGRKT